MSGLDPRARIKLKERLLAEKSKGKTIFFSSHILSDIDEICDRIGVINATKLVFTGLPSDFKKQHPSDSLEKSFLSAIAA
jgi:ABC-2 type transport system ATP-binding protein